MKISIIWIFNSKGFGSLSNEYNEYISKDEKMCVNQGFGSVIINLKDPHQLDADPPENSMKFIMSKRENYHLIGFQNYKRVILSKLCNRN